jgi:hypothetical protein
MRDSGGLLHQKEKGFHPLYMGLACAMVCINKGMKPTAPRCHHILVQKWE